MNIFLIDKKDCLVLQYQSEMSFQMVCSHPRIIHAGEIICWRFFRGYTRERQNGFNGLISPKNVRQIKNRAVSDTKYSVTNNQRSLCTSFPLWCTSIQTIELTITISPNYPIVDSLGEETREWITCWAYHRSL